ncbi:hypothetical protein SB861_40240 [Paraburkholderia sp. SIMBA_049]
MFLIFPNPQVPPEAPELQNAQTLSADYARAYYAAVDPFNEKDTLDKWKAANGFGSGSGTEVTAIFGDVRDLGYGRRMTARLDPARGTIAFLVENYLVSPGGAYGYSPESLAAAIASDTRWRVQYNAIEYSLGPNPAPGDKPFAKFYNFDPATGQRQLTVNIDGRGQKAMPAVCFTCHGGRGDALEKDASGNLFYGHPMFAASHANGDAQARLHPFEVGNFDFSTTAGHTRADYEVALKFMNRLVLCTYPAANGSGLDNCPGIPGFGREASVDEWQGGAAKLIRNAYGGNSLPNDTYLDTYVPDTWSAGNATNLYQSVFAKSCRSCHMLRDNGRTDELSGYQHIDFDNFPVFRDTYGKLARHYVFDLGNMPLAQIVYNNFWKSDEPELLAKFLESISEAPSRDASGKLLQPGLPLADPGPRVRTVLPGWVALRAVETFNDAYSWSVIQAPTGLAPASVQFEGANLPQARFNATALGDYIVQLVTSRAGVESAPQTVTVTVADATVLPELINQNAIRLSDIKTIMRTGFLCTQCHDANTSPVPPMDLASDVGFYERVRSRINFRDTALSRLLVKPSKLVPHAGGQVDRFDTSQPGGNVGRVNYDNFANWIANGAPQ